MGEEKIPYTDFPPFVMTESWLYFLNTVKEKAGVEVYNAAVIAIMNQALDQDMELCDSGNRIVDAAVDYLILQEITFQQRDEKTQRKLVEWR